MKVKRVYQAALAGSFAVSAFATDLFAQTQYRGDQWTSSQKDVGSYASTLADVIMMALLAVSFVVGAGMVIMGLVGFAQKRENPEAAQGAPRKLMAGGGLLAITIILGVLRATVFSAG